MKKMQKINNDTPDISVAGKVSTPYHEQLSFYIILVALVMDLIVISLDDISAFVSSESALSSFSGTWSGKVKGSKIRPCYFLFSILLLDFRKKYFPMRKVSFYHLLRFSEDNFPFTFFIFSGWDKPTNWISQGETRFSCYLRWLHSRFFLATEGSRRLASDKWKVGEILKYWASDVDVVVWKRNKVSGSMMVQIQKHFFLPIIINSK